MSTPVFFYGRPVQSEITAREFLSGVRRLCRVAARNFRLSTGERPAGKQAWVYLRIARRAEILDVVAGWLAAWPAEFVRWAKSHNLTQHYLASEFGPWPAWTTEALRCLDFSHGKVNVKRKRRRLTFGSLKRTLGNGRAYRETRAALLLERSSTKEGMRH